MYGYFRKLDITIPHGYEQVGLIQAHQKPEPQNLLSTF